MKRTLLNFFGVLLVVSLSSLNGGATLDDKIKEQLEKTPPNDFIRAIVVMSRQVNLRRIAGTHAKITALQQTANQTQGGLIKALSKELADGSVKSYRSFWIFNGLHVIATPKMLRQISTHAGVRMILPDRFYPRPQLFYD